MKINAVVLLISALACSAQAAVIRVKLSLVTPEGITSPVGEVTIVETDYGLTFTPHLTGLTPGTHGFHIHANGSCAVSMVDGKAVAAGAAGGHLDPAGSHQHLGPWQNGHLGDLPALVVNADGKADYPVLAPRIKKIAEIRRKALMVHLGSDNYADHPQALGGGGARVACGVITG